MVFCNKDYQEFIKYMVFCHNPYFNRWFSAIEYNSFNEAGLSGHNPYFNRWFSAIQLLG